MPMDGPGACNKFMSITFLKSPSHCFVGSPAQARNIVIPASVFSTVAAAIPLFGFGTFASSQPSITGNWDTSSKTYNNFGENPPTPPIAYNTVWPAIYARCTETWTESTGTLTYVNTYTQYNDQQPMQTSSSSGSVTGGTVNSVSITPTLLTVVYFGGTYTAQLSGSVLNPSGPGPFNPLDVTYGWAALTAACNAFLNTLAIPPFPVTGLPPVVGSVSQVSNPLSTGGANNTGVGVWVASMNGFPWITGGSNSILTEMFPVIVDNSNPDDVDNLGGTLQNSGYCTCAKSLWHIEYGDTAHKQLYVQAYDPSNFLVSGSIAAATAFPSPLSLPTLRTFVPSDVAANSSSTYGILAFKNVGI